MRLKKQLVKLPGGMVVASKPDPMAKYLIGDITNTSMLHAPTLVQSSDSQEKWTPSQSGEPDHQVMDLSVLEGTRVLILGAGAIGSHVAYLLATTVPLNISAVDFDIIEYSNIRSGRTVFEAGQIRKRKVLALKEKIERDCPGSTVEPLPYDVLELPDIFLSQLAKKAAIVINAIDSSSGMLKVNDICYSLVEILFVGVHHRAETGHIIVTVPFATACLRCCMDINSPNDIRTLHSEPGWSIDIKNIANHTAVLALEIMYAKAMGLPIQRWDVSKNIFFIANRRERYSPDGPGLHLQKGHKRPGCPVCSVAPATINPR